MKKHFFFLLLCIATLSSHAVAQTGTDSSATVLKPDKFPDFKGGLDGWARFLEKNLDRDLMAKQNAPSGSYKVVASFLIDTDGSVKDIKIEEDPGYGAADEMKKMLRFSSKRWIPAYSKGQPIPYRHRQSITLTNL